MKRIVLALAVVVPLFGCGNRSKETPVFDKVEIERLLPLDARAKTTIQDRETVAKLVEHFPEIGRGKSSDIAAGWKAAYRLRFVRSQGDAIKVTVDSKGELWSEGNGDWRAKPGMKDFLDKMFTEKADKRSAGSWSEAVNGLRGRLVRYAPSQVNKTEIIGLEMELENVSTEPLAVQNDTASVRVRLIGPDGQSIEPSLPIDRSGPVADPKWCVLSRGESLSFSLYDYGVGVPEMNGALLALLPPSRVWMLKPGKYTLRGKFTVRPAGDEEPPKNAWKGQLDLPSLAIEVR